MILLLWLVNFLISAANAWGCGKTWNESKHVGGAPHFMNWCGAIMSACGFSWCYGVVFGFFGSQYSYEHSDHVVRPLLSPAALEAFADLGYLAIIFPVLGTGIAITVHSWGVFWRRRSLGDGAVAGWNSFAQVYNVVSALRDVPRATRGVADFFLGDGDGEDRGKGVVLLLVVGALALGILTTYWILTTTARSTAQERWFASRARA